MLNLAGWGEAAWHHGPLRATLGLRLDNMGVDMLQGGGKLFLGSGGRFVGPGHFGLLDLGDGVEKFSCH